MAKQNLVLVQTLCTHYEIEESFLNDLGELGLVQVIIIEDHRYVEEDHLARLEKMIRLRHELDLNLEAIDVVVNLLQKVETLQNELNEVNSRLRFYEE